jgi:hypothetical protein
MGISSLKGWSRMAKGKRSVALFEVIQTDKRFQRQKPPQNNPQTLPPKTSPTPQAVSPKIFTGAKIAAPPPIIVKPAGPDWRTRWVTSYRALQARCVRQYQATIGAIFGRLQPLIAKHAGVLIGVMSALTVMGGVVIARHSLRPPTTPIASLASADDIRTQTPHPSVLDLTSTPTDFATAAAQPNQPNPTANPGVNPAANPDAAALSDDAATAEPASSIFTPNVRQVNLNYVLVQSYGDKKTAQEACDFLNKNGVPCTIEQGVKNWRKDFYLVIGLQGFTRISGPDYATYYQKIQQLSALFAPNKHSYKRFDPQAIKWDRAN